MGMSAAHCQGIVREMSGNFRVSGEWSPYTWAGPENKPSNFTLSCWATERCLIN